MKNIICITPIKHINGMYDKLEKFGNIIYEPEITKFKLKKVLSNLKIEYLLTIANKQNFILDDEVLNGSQLKVINTCSRSKFLDASRTLYVPSIFVLI